MSVGKRIEVDFWFHFEFDAREAWQGLETAICFSFSLSWSLLKLIQGLITLGCDLFIEKKMIQSDL